MTQKESVSQINEALPRKKYKFKRIKIFDAILYLFFTIVLLIFLLPILQMLAISFNDALDGMDGGFYLIPRVFTFANYQAVFSNEMIYKAYLVTILKTIVGTAASVLATGLFAFGMAKKHLKFRKVYSIIALVTMFFGGGLLPYFVLIRNLRLYNNFLVYIIPQLISVWNMLIMKAFFESLSESIEESAKIDGCNYWQIFFRIIIPVSGPIIATIALYNGVAQWNGWFDAYLFIDNSDLLPLQTILVKMLSSVDAVPPALNEMVSKGKITAQALRVTTMIVSIGPIVLIYPFLQKFFVKGIMLGAIKG